MRVLNRISAIPDPWNTSFLLIAVCLSVIVPAAVCYKNGGENLLAAGLVLVSAMFIAWSLIRAMRGDHSGTSASLSRLTRARVPLLWLGGACLMLIPAIVVADVSLPGVLLLLLPMLLFTALCIYSDSRAAQLILAPLALGWPFTATSIVMGLPSGGGFPAALAVLFGHVAFTMRDLELRLRKDSVEDDPASRSYYGRTLAWISTVLFFFGVVALWPWLGKIYGNSYFWILVIGVLSPMLFFWGRLRQPHVENPLEALFRLNRLLPYIGIILLIAIWVG